MIVVGNLNVASLSAPDVYVQIVTPPSYVRGVPTDVIGVVGTASWGPVNKPVHMGSGQDATVNFGPISAAALSDPFDLATDLYIAFGQASSQGTLEGFGVRVTDGTDTAASAAIPGASATHETATITDSIANDDVLNIIFTSSAVTGSPVTISVTATGTDTVTTLAAKFVTAIGANTALKAVGVYATSLAGVVSIYQPSTLSPAIVYTESVSPGSETITLASGTAATGGATITAKYTGVLGDNVSVTMAPGAITGTFTATVQPFAGTPEIYPNIPGGLGFWQAFVNAINMGLSNFRGPSQYVTAVLTNPAVGNPTAATTALAGGTDGRSAITSANLVGSATAVPGTGLFALNGASPAVGIAWVAGLTDTTVASTALVFGQTGAASLLFALAAGQTTAQKQTTVQGIGIADPSFLWTGDWIYFFDPINNVTRLVSENAYIGGMWATLTPAQSALNNPVNLVVGTERNNPFTGNQPYTESEIGQLQTLGILVITNPIPAGQQFGVRTGASTSSNAGTAPMEYWRMTAFLARSLNASMGLFVGQLQSQQPNDPVRASVNSVLNQFISQLVGASLIDSGVVICTFSAASTAKPGMGVNTPSSIAAHYLYALVRITYLSSVWYFVLQLQGGTTVVSVQSGNAVSPPT